jgi:benzoate-CoA ligase
MSGDGHDPYNATVDLLERNLAKGKAERPYLRTADRVFSYGEVVARADAAGAGLLGLGLGPGDRVILATRDRPEFVMTFWGAIKAGLVPVPISDALSSIEIGFILRDSEADVIVCDAATAPAVVPAAEGTDATALLVDPAPGGDVLSWNEVCGAPATLDVAATTREDVALWLYTSGTTGEPKGAIHRHGHLERTPGPYSVEIAGMSEDDTILSMSKMFFAYGLGNSVYLPAAAGASVVLNDAPSIPGFVNDLIGRTQPTMLFGVPAFHAGFLRLADAKLPSTVRWVQSAGETLSSELFTAYQDRFDLPLIDGLGATEALHFITSNRPDDVVAGSAGAPVRGWDVKVLSEDGEPVADDAPGELWCTGPSTFAGYWRRPELTERAYRDGWMRTGDVVRLRDGHVFHEGRFDDLMKVGGIWVAPTEVEAVLTSHPDVEDAAVVSVDEGTGVPVVKAYLIATREDGPLRQELIRLCRSRLASYKVPIRYEVVDELPRTTTGKLRRFILRTPEGRTGGEDGR